MQKNKDAGLSKDLLPLTIIILLFLLLLLLIWQWYDLKMASFDREQRQSITPAHSTVICKFL